MEKNYIMYYKIFTVQRNTIQLSTCFYQFNEKNEIISHIFLKYH